MFAALARFGCARRASEQRAVGESLCRLAEETCLGLLSLLRVAMDHSPTCEVDQGIADLAGLLLSTGWALFLVPAIWFPTVLLNARCWQVLFAPPYGPTFLQAFHAQYPVFSLKSLVIFLHENNGLGYNSAL